jgi:hypothetical protein
MTVVRPHIEEDPAKHIDAKIFGDPAIHDSKLLLTLKLSRF